MDFETLLESLMNPVEGVEQSPTIYDDLSAAHTNRVSAGDSMVATLTEQIAGLEATIVALQAHNYQLLMATPKADNEPGDGDGDNEGDEHDENVPDPTAEELFFEEN